MDYEKKYKEALNWMKDVYPTLEGATKEDAEHYFPELKESEDEKIRKEMITYLSTVDDKELIPYESWIDWLEKQGEPSVRWNENTDGNKPQKNHSVLIKTTHGIAEGEWKGDDSWIQYRWSSSIKDSDVLFWIELSDLEKQREKGTNEREIPFSEQKAVDKVKHKFKVGDEIKPVDEESLIITKIDKEGYWSDDLLICDFDEECIWDLVEQKPAWSEEDEMQLDAAIHLVSSTGHIETANWLKTFKDRVQSQSK